MLQPLRHRPILRAVAAVVAFGAVAAGCGSSDTATTTTTIALPTRVVMTRVAGNTESELLFALYSQALEDAGLRVVRKDAVPDRAALYAAVQSGSVQLAPDFSGQFLDYLTSTGATPATTVASTVPDTTAGTGAASSTPGTAPGSTPGSAPGTDALGSDALPTTTALPLPDGPPRTVDQQEAVIRSLLPATLTTSTVSTAEDKQVVACSAGAVAKHTLGTDTDLGVASADIVLGGPTGFETAKPFGAAAIEAAYNATFKDVVTLAPADIAAAVKDGKVDCVVVDSTDPVIGAQKLTVLLDDKALVPPNGAFALVTTAAATPEVTVAINAVNAKLTTAAFADLVDQVVNKGREPDYLASLFLQRKS